MANDTRKAETPPPHPPPHMRGEVEGDRLYPPRAAGSRHAHGRSRLAAWRPSHQPRRTINLALARMLTRTPDAHALPVVESSRRCRGRVLY